MKEIFDYIQQGKLLEAISYCEQQLKDDPVNFDIRSQFIELLCLNNELERADKQLDYMVQKNPDFAVGAMNLRQLVRAEQARQDFYQGKAAPKLFHDNDDLDAIFLELRIALNEGDSDTAQRLAKQLEEQRANPTLAINDAPCTDFRDLDDSLNNYIELLGTNGEFYLARSEEILSIEFKQPESLVEHLWLRVEIDIKDGPSGEAHIPAIYGGDNNEIERLGQATEWQQLGDELYIGRGLKMWFVDGEAVAINQITTVAQQSEQAA
ncbi:MULTISPECIES: type VI secretion system accessory protein TagJ [Pseudoalteromonas]|uniref:Virulence protein, SciE type n=1 Tax=Pseudoalteromonas ruthenica TaxID=151081 RepID=A0A0F4PHF6_9GAMM|nr:MULTISPECIES: type VI secretion system accessory protein TagJ [Pseudoalteromonas]KJY94488.1 virulence protein, SciE type [Pseudoalteromonas ruthenica]KJZ00609.1 virulence protein, SciE type [Pseudoalteromonas ruthenica]MCG7544949.1 virulence protein, SciE type [Pseudoalteromonas sp. MM17-2]MCG7565771.1 virulence protein, SciE type [Pseudoalteromonas sp. CnMc7-15]MCG7569392.1 virulence protein, SciE type [Pseudoalteromonas sp. CNC9-20]|tara:strand:- start:113 stop:910 length:798 start_codon:yes stop_codon:yes gene_type:complete